MIRRWTQDMDDYLAANRGKLSSDLIGEHLNVSRNAVVGRAKRLGLVRLRNTNPEQCRKRRRGVGLGGPKIRIVKAVDYLSRAVPVEPLNIRYSDLQWFHCREIVGKDDSGLPLSCGHRKLEDGPWFCRWHHAVNFTKPQPARARAFPSFGQKQRAA